MDRSYDSDDLNQDETAGRVASELIWFAVGRAARNDALLSISSPGEGEALDVRP
jgi:hypothetical protein